MQGSLSENDEYFIRGQHYQDANSGVWSESPYIEW